MCSWIGRFNVRRTVIFPKIIYRLNEVLTKISIELFMEIDALILKLTLTRENTHEFSEEGSGRVQDLSYQI